MIKKRVVEILKKRNEKGLKAQIVSSFGRITHYAPSFASYFCSIKTSKYSKANF